MFYKHFLLRTFRYGGLMLQGLTAQEAPDCVQLLIVGQLQRCLGDEDLVELVVKHNLLTPLISNLEAELAVAKEVTRWAVSLAESRLGLARLTSAETVGQLTGISQRSSVLQMRVLDLVVKVAQISEDHLEAVRATELLCQLPEILASSDFLLQLNSIELLTDLALTSHGQKYLETTGVFTSLNTMLLDCPNLPFGHILLPSE